MDSARVARRKQVPPRRPPDDEPLPRVRRFFRRHGSLFWMGPWFLLGPIDRYGARWTALFVAVGIALHLFMLRRDDRAQAKLNQPPSG